MAVALAALCAIGSTSALGQVSNLDDTVPTKADGAGGTTTLPTVTTRGCNDPACHERPKGPTQTTGIGIGSGGARFGDMRSDNDGGRGNADGDNTDPKKSSDKMEPQCGNPIIVATGNKIEPEQDFITAGEAALQLKRTWNQHAYEVGLFGYSWLSSFDYRLSFSTSSPFGPVGTCYARPSVPQCTNTASHTVIWAHRPDGRKIQYTKAADGIYYEDKPTPIAKIVRQSDGRWILYGERNDVEVYTASGLPISIKNSHGVGWTFTHGGMNGSQLQRVTHTSGRYVQFVWTGDELREVKDPAGGSFQYTYGHQKISDGLHLLKTVTLPAAPATTITYHYEGEAGEPDYARYALTGKSYNGIRYSHFKYDSLMRAISTEHVGGVDKYAYVYTEAADGSLTVSETNPLNKKATYYFNPAGKLTEMIGLASAHCPGTSRGASYDSNGYPDVVVDLNGNATDFNYSASGLLQSKTEAQGKPEARTSTYVWDVAKNRITSVTVQGHSKIAYTYATDNRVATMTVTNLTAHGVVNQSRATSYAYTKHSNGLLASVKTDGPLPGTGDVITESYDAYGNLTSISNSLGQSTTYATYNARGQPGRITGPNGDITDYTYDARGRVTTVKRYVNGAWQTTTYQYNAAGLLESVTRPDGQKRTYVYDAARRLVREYEPETATTFAQRRYTYNDMSLVTRIDTERTTTPLTAPAISASPTTSSTGSYSVSWTAVADTTAYKLYEKVGSGAWTQIVNANVTTKAISGKTNGTYSYYVEACNSAGCGPNSATINVIVSLSGPPPAPTMTAPPSYSYGGNYNAAWGSVVGATSYRLEESGNGQGWLEIYNGTSTSRSFSKTVSATFSYRVRACNSAGCSTYSPTRTVTVEIESCPTCFAPPSPPVEGQVGSSDEEGGQ